MMILANALAIRNQVLCDSTNHSEWFLYLSCDALIFLNQSFVFFNFFVHHMECCNVLNYDHGTFLAHVRSRLLLNHNYFLAILFFQIGLIQVDLIVFRVSKCRVFYDLCKTEFFYWNLVVAVVFERDKDERFQHLSCQFSGIVDMGLFN